MTLSGLSHQLNGTTEVKPIENSKETGSLEEPHQQRWNDNNCGTTARNVSDVSMDANMQKDDGMNRYSTGPTARFQVN